MSLCFFLIFAICAYINLIIKPWPCLTRTSTTESVYMPPEKKHKHNRPTLMDQEWKKVTETVLCWMNVLQNTERKIYEIRVCTQQKKSEMERYSIISCRSVSICSPLFNFTSSYHLCTSCFLEYLDNTHRNWNTTQSHTWQVCAVSNLDLADLSAPTLIYWNVCACVCVLSAVI